MKKSVSLSLSGIILATSLGMPYTEAKASTNTQSSAMQENQNDRNRSVDSDRIARQSAKENGANLQRYDIEKQNRGKATWTLKGLKSVLSAKKTQINNAIKTAIDKLPLSSSAKKKWAATITVDGLIKYLNHITNFSGNAEDAIIGWLNGLGVPNVVSTVVVKTISFFLV
ncbi:hypothetical protein MKZ74_12625 [Staphylococcus haemolyticus]|uniref:hypothetical protein n=1 Tax=Staphylococcus haemolyticus TaxID=1283 RepID=UPI001F5D1F94|nr:hypothetical protein [Staphylococcus haemolyticus]MCI3140190.1 hypothetical protein [Staphylococcus haemolyticus]